MSSNHRNDPEFLTRLRSFGAEWLPGQRLSELTSLGVGGRADLVLIKDHARVPELTDFLKGSGVEWIFMGGGTNLLVPDEDLRKLVLQLSRRATDMTFDGRRVEASAAASLGRTVMECAKRNLGGMEGLIGVPGTVGGALRMNAGAYGTQIGDVVKSVKVFRGARGAVEEVTLGKVKFEYRHTSFAPDDLMLSVNLELPERPYAQILERIKQCNQKRRASQPINEKSAGCIFKNPPGLSAGKMIDELGLKGTRVGGAVISERHANFLVNRYQATAADILRLMDLIRERVFKAYGVELEEEVIVWRDVGRN